MPLSLIEEPDGLPLDAKAVRDQVRWTSEDEDEFITGQLIPAVCERAQSRTRRQVMTATYDLLLDCFPWINVIEVPKPPLRSITHIKYLDTAGTLQTWASSNYVYQTLAGPKAVRGRITPAYGVSWPSTREQIGAVQIRFVCGYGESSEDVPALLRQAMLLDIGGLWKFREDLIAGAELPEEIPNGARSIYRTFQSKPALPFPPGYVDAGYVEL